MPHTFACLLGSAPALALAELQAVLGAAPDFTAEQYAVFKDVEIPALATGATSEERQTFFVRLQNLLGGTVKLVELRREVSEADDAALTAALTECLVATSETSAPSSASSVKINFGIGEWGRDHLPQVSAFNIKTSLQEKGFKVRFFEGSRSGLPTALLSHRKVTEMIVLRCHDATWVGETVSVTNPDEWSTRDRGKPYADHKKGLLPPKVARMMVNVSLGTSRPGFGTRFSVDAESSAFDAVTLLDPFCGSGTIMMEARTLGVEAVGSDLDSAAVAGTRKNLLWQNEREGLTSDFELQTGDVSHVTWNKKITYLVTEPFLGKPKPRPDDVANIFRGLEKLYWGSFRHWTSQLVDQAIVTIVFPAVRVGNKRFDLAHLIDKLEQLGYTIASGPHPYHRPDAITEREIYTFRYVTR